MIKVFGRMLCVPEGEKKLGFVKDNLVETRQFKITAPALFSFSFKLELENGSHKNIMDLSPVRTEDALILSWEIPAACLMFPGFLYAQLRGFSADGEVWHSEIGEFTVCPSIDAEAAFPPLVPSEFSEMEKRMTATAERAEVAATMAKASTEEAATYPASIMESAEKAKENADFTASALTDVCAILQSVKEMEAAISTTEKTVQKAEEEVARQGSISRNAADTATQKVAEISAILGDMHSVLDHILSMERMYVGGESV